MGIGFAPRDQSARAGLGVSNRSISSRTLRIWSPNGKAPLPRKNRPFFTSPRSAAASWLSMQN